MKEKLELTVGTWGTENQGKSSENVGVIHAYPKF